MNEVHFSSDSCEWGTPKALFDEWHREFNFTLDPCATPGNAKCPRYFSRFNNGLEQDWGKETVFMNPPYGREIGHWMHKAFQSAQAGATVVCLVPARTDTTWWHNYAIHGEVRFLKGRLKFEIALSADARQQIEAMISNGDGLHWIAATFNIPVSAVRAIERKKERLTQSAPFPSALVILRPPATHQV